MGCKSTSLNEAQNLKLQRTDTDSCSNQDEASQTKPLRYATKVSKFDREVRKPYCTDFGPDRDIIWKDYLFCDNCKTFEKDSGKFTRKITRSSAYECVANHRSFDHPTTLKDDTQQDASKSSLFFHFHERKKKKILDKALRICRP